MRTRVAAASLAALLGMGAQAEDATDTGSTILKENIVEAKSSSGEQELERKLECIKEGGTWAQCVRDKGWKVTVVGPASEELLMEYVTAWRDAQSKLAWPRNGPKIVVTGPDANDPEFVQDWQKTVWAAVAKGHGLPMNELSGVPEMVIVGPAVEDDAGVTVLRSDMIGVPEIVIVDETPEALLESVRNMRNSVDAITEDTNVILVDVNQGEEHEGRLLQKAIEMEVGMSGDMAGFLIDRVDTDDWAERVTAAESIRGVLEEVRVTMGVEQRGWFEKIFLNGPAWFGPQDYVWWSIGQSAQWADGRKSVLD